MKVFLIRPVRGISEEYALGIETQRRYLESKGYEVYDPIRDTDQRDRCGLRICKDNRRAMVEADLVCVIWDGKSTGCLFDLGMAFALDKPIRTIVGYFPKATIEKSFANMIFAWEDEK